MLKVFRRDKTKKYVCDICGNQFNWNKQASWFGQADQKPEIIVCSDKCKKDAKTV